MTHRQYLMWQLWLDRQWNLPDRSDHYSMRIAEEVGKLRKDNLRTGGYYETMDKFKVLFDTSEQKALQAKTKVEEEPEDDEYETVIGPVKKQDRQIPGNLNLHAMTVNAKALWAARRKFAEEEQRKGK